MQRRSRPIRLVGVKQNNLKNITVEFPARKLSVVTGLSGSGKSSLVFDTLYAEGQRRYVESLSTYTRQFLEKMPKPEIDSIENIPPAIALEQRNHVMNSRSTVGTQTEILDYLRVLYARVGRTTCVECQGPVEKLNAQSLTELATESLGGKKSLLVAPLSLTPPASGDPSTEGGKTKTKKTKRAAKAPSRDSLASVLRGTGFTRVLWAKAKTKTKYTFEIFELETDGIPEAPPLDELFIVVDRIKLPKSKASELDPETLSRLQDSIEQALRVGRGRVGLANLDDSTFKIHDERFACRKCGTEHPLPEPNLFSFNSPLGACSACSGFGHTLEISENLVVPDPSRTLKNDAIDPLGKPSAVDWKVAMFKFAERHGINIGKRYRELTAAQKKLLWHGDPEEAKKSRATTFPGIYGCFEELKRWKYKLHVRVFIRRYQSQNICTSCKGARLGKFGCAVRIGDYNMPELLELPISKVLPWCRELPKRILTEGEIKISSDALTQVERRLSFLDEVGVEYLTLARLAKTLSGGEFQRINLATQLGNGLCGTLYVLDEPSIGLHAADTDRLIRVLERLRDQGNTVVVVEHDLEVMKKADWLVELGPGAGRRGGELVAQGDAAALERVPSSLTGKYLSGAFFVSRSRPPRPTSRKFIRLEGCSENNLSDINVDFPLGRLVVVTGVSGSGKSTLVHRTLYGSLSKFFDASYPEDEIGAYDRLYGAEQIRGVVLLDQSPIGKTSRSNPATYLKAWDEVRRLYANQALSLRRGYTPQHFSFNVDGGRCPVCKGEGEITLDMHFMAEVKIPCEECEGRRFKKTVLDVTYRGKNVHQLLETTIDDAYELFRDNPVLARKFGTLRDVGLGYLHVGQPAPTLSGGESQRLKIASVLEDREALNQLYIFDEPTTGLHIEDIKKLLNVLQDLVDSGNSVMLIEHNLDVIASADWVIDLGPGGGSRGGKLVAQGTPEQLAAHPDSATGAMLKRHGIPAVSPREAEFESRFSTRRSEMS